MYNDINIHNNVLLSTNYYTRNIRDCVLRMNDDHCIWFDTPSLPGGIPGACRYVCFLQ